VWFDEEDGVARVVQQVLVAALGKLQFLSYRLPVWKLFYQGH
jgi:hypothetical protein